MKLSEEEGEEKKEIKNHIRDIISPTLVQCDVDCAICKCLIPISILFAAARLQKLKQKINGQVFDVTTLDVCSQNSVAIC